MSTYSYSPEVVKKDRVFYSVFALVLLSIAILMGATIGHVAHKQHAAFVNLAPSGASNVHVVSVDYNSKYMAQLAWNKGAVSCTQYIDEGASDGSYFLAGKASCVQPVETGQ